MPAKTEAALVRQLTNLRLSQGVSQGQLARKIGITQPAIAKIEALRVKNLRFRTLSRAAVALGASLEMKIVPRRGTSTKIGGGKYNRKDGTLEWAGGGVKPCRRNT